MADAVATDRRASAGEVRAQAEAVRRLASGLGLLPPRLRDGGTVVVHVRDSGYRTANRYSSAASSAVGAYVHVITADVAGATSAQEL